MVKIFHVLTLFPDLFPGPLAHGLAGKAREQGIYDLNITNIRDFAKDKYGSVDDEPFGGGAGMVMRADIVGEAMESALETATNPHLIFPTPRGHPLAQKHFQKWASHTGDLLFLCGRYEGVDQRVVEHFSMEEVSLGDFILMGGEMPTFTMIEGTVRLLPGVLGNQMSIMEESFSTGLLEYPHYTRPRVWKEKTVPEVLLSGNHAHIEAWRKSESISQTKRVRPDLINPVDDDKKL